ncbi:MAG: hypothetical protein HYZ28_23055 [Myxococcales bacterium]|nr:hypothetical protein [Myxococcales bacterium]
MRWLAAAVLAVLAGCSAWRIARPEATEAPAPGGRYVDRQLGFELVRPAGPWRLDANDEVTAEGVSVPVVLRNETSGAQVVLQIAPAAATPSQYAERLNDGLRRQPGFLAGDPAPVPLAEDAVGFSFRLGEKVEGKVAVFRGGPGRVFLVLGTWPRSSLGAGDEVDRIFASVRAVPRG